MFQVRMCTVVMAAFAAASFAVPSLVRAQVPDRPHDVVVPDSGSPAAAPATRPAAGEQVPAVVPERPLSPLEPEGKRIYHGVCINSENAADFPDRVARYAAIAGHRPAVCVQFAHAFDATKAIDWDYHAKALRTIDKEGAIPFVKATTQTWDNKRISETGFFFKADDILAGKHDAFFVKAAQVCRAFSKPMFISWNHEMNGDWYSYSEPYAAKRPEIGSDWTAAKYVEFHRRVWRIFKEQGADNVAFTFAPAALGRALHEYDELHGWKPYYPGDEYVDWVAPSYYNNNNPTDLDVMARAINKPMFLSEWGSAANRPKWYRPQPYPGDAAWMAMTMDFMMHRYPNLKGSAYYQWEKGFVLQRTPEQVPPYVNALNDPMFIHGPASSAAEPAATAPQGGSGRASTAR